MMRPFWELTAGGEAARVVVDEIHRVDALHKRQTHPLAGGVEDARSNVKSGKRHFTPRGDEDENTPIDATARTSTSRTLVVSEAQPDGDETSPPQQDTEHPTPVASPRASSPKRARVEPAKEPILLTGSSTTPSLDDPLMKEFIRLGAQFVGYRDHAKKLEENLAESNKHADALATKLEQSEKARKKAEADAAAIEGLRKRLHDAETSLSGNIAQQSAREKEILTRLESQSRRFVNMSKIVAKCLSKMSERKRDVGKIDDVVTPVAEDMMDELLRMDAEFFVKGSYAEHSTRAERVNIDDILGIN
ncbi:hypothetical protein QYE76_014373 [Lolium multiflorum]|uniref:Uncharacterized protein n=1 Tax=Lolium multiflorum TaxID=4521 RepID=A0AAD8U2E1_LOLMU|nr:hypothetical protein QYE76_014373 [Lolium multiflorum]